MGPEARQSRLALLRSCFSTLAALVSPVALWAQSCPLCYQAAAASPHRFIQALRSGILILIFPPVLIFTGISVMAYRKRNKCVED